MMADATFGSLLRRQLAARDAATGRQFVSCSQILSHGGAYLPDLGPSRLADSLRRETEICVAPDETEILGETEIRSPTIETEICAGSRETENQPSGETENQIAAPETEIRKRGRPRRGTVAPWIAAGVSRATWFRRKRVAAVPLGGEIVK